MILIEQTNHCNLHCIFCPNRLAQRERGYMSAEMFESCIDQILANSPRKPKYERVALHFFGEPLLSPFLFSNLKYLEKNGFSNIDIVTNGMLLTNNMVKELTAYRCIKKIRVSLNSSRKDVMEQINSGSVFDTVVENIRNLLLKAQDKAVEIQLMVTTKNQDEDSEDIYSLFQRSDFMILKKYLHNYRGQLPYDLCMVKHYYTTVDCGYKFADDLCIQWNGDLVGCCGDDTKSQIYGNVRDGIFSDNVQNKKRSLQTQLCKREFDNLPLCKKCVEAL